jgi:hypothetical protein
MWPAKVASGAAARRTVKCNNVNAQRLFVDLSFPLFGEFEYYVATVSPSN